MRSTLAFSSAMMQARGLAADAQLKVASTHVRARAASLDAAAKACARSSVVTLFRDAPFQGRGARNMP